MNDYSDEPLHRLEPAYLEHYGLDEPPFSAMVDERFYFNSIEAGQRMSLLVHMTQYSDMVLMVLGEEGMGKSTLLQNYIKSAHDNWHICRINANSMMDKDQLLFRIAEDFGLDFLPSDSAELQELLYDKMTQLLQNDVLPVIIVDDAHELPVDALSQLFIMAEIKAGDTTMVHVVLFAEPEINKTINASSARKIRERIGHEFELGPLDEAETAEYILRRLTVAGLHGENPFSAKVVRQIHKQSHGNPARINELAHIALDEAQGGNEPEYDEPDEFDEVSNRRVTPMRVLAVLIIASLAGLGLWYQDQINQIFNGAPTATVAETTTVAEAETATDTNTSPADSPPAETPFARLKEKIISLNPDQKDEPTTPASDVATTANPAAPLNQIEDPAIAEQLANQPVAAKLSPILEAIEPASLTASLNKQTITLRGKNFTADTDVTLSWSGNQKTLPRSRITLANDTTLQFDVVTGKDADTWTVQVRNAIGETSSAKFQVSTAKQAVVTKAPSKGMDAEQWLQSQPPKNLTLQLLGSHHLKPIDQYIAEQQLDKEAVIYKTTHQGKDWYVLFYGSFADQQQAQQAIAQLSKKAKANKPWVRSFASIRRPARATTTATTPPPALSTAPKKAPSLSNLKAHEAWLWSQDPSHFTLQLLGTQNVNNIKQFIKQHQLRGKVVYYHTQRDNQDWYALVYGTYPNNADAKSAVNQLPDPIRKLSPWVRNFSAIHAEMDKPTRP